MKKRKGLWKKIGYLFLTVSLLASSFGSIPVMAATETGEGEVSSEGLITGALATSEESVIDGMTEDSSEEEPQYVTITNKEYELYADLAGTKLSYDQDLYQRTFILEEELPDEAGANYYQISGEDFFGYIPEADATLGTEAWGPRYELSEAVTIKNPDISLFDETFTEIGKASQLTEVSYQATGVYHHSDGKEYYYLIDANGAFAGILESSGTEPLAAPPVDTGASEEQTSDTADSSKNTTEQKDSETSEEATTTENPESSEQATVSENAETTTSTINEAPIKKAARTDESTKASSEETKAEIINTYVTITKKSIPIWEVVDEKKLGTTDSLLDHTYHSTEKLTVAEKVYYGLYDKNNKFVGYVAETAVKLANTPAGIRHSTNQYGTVTKNNGTLWKNLTFTSKTSTSSLQNRTYHIKEWYRHLDGTKFFALYGSNGKLVGYLNANAVAIAATPGGIWHADNHYVSLTKKNWTIWKDFSFKSGISTNTLLDQTVHVKGWYRHYNGRKYLSLYNNQGKWLGYLNEDGGKTGKGRGGAWHGTKQYVTVTKKSWTIWTEFDFKNGRSTSSLYHKTYRVKGWYRHYNGKKYLSLYDHNGKWQGYLNANGAKTGKGRGGIWHKTSQYVKVTKSNWSVWTEFDFKSGTSTKPLTKRIFKVKGWYQHYNGKKYYSLYDFSGKWQGYINAKGTKVTTLPKSKMLNQVPWVSQFVPYYTPKGCAGASMTMLLRSKGVNVSLKYVQDNLPMYPAVSGGQIGNPYSIYGFKRVIQPDALTNYAKRWYPYVRNITGYTPAQIKKEVLSGHPVLYIGCSSYHRGGPARNHCKVITGYKNGKFRVYDPLYNTAFDKPMSQGLGVYDRGPIHWVNAKQFKAEYVGKAIVID